VPLRFSIRYAEEAQGVQAEIFSDQEFADQGEEAPREEAAFPRDRPGKNLADSDAGKSQTDQETIERSSTGVGLSSTGVGFSSTGVGFSSTGFEFRATGTSGTVCEIATASGSGDRQIV